LGETRRRSGKVRVTFAWSSTLLWPLSW
jgi:hypothetical protein